MPLVQTGEGSTRALNRSELSKIDTDVSAKQRLCASTVSSPNCKDGKGSVNSMETFPVNPNLEPKDEVDTDMTKQSLELQSVHRCSYTSKRLLKLNTPYRRFKKQNRKSKWSDDCLELECSIASPSYRPKCMKTVGSSTWTTDPKLADLTYKPVTIVGLSLGPTMMGANAPLSPMTVQEDFNIYLKQNMGSVLLPRLIPSADCEETSSKSAREIGNDVSCSEQLTEEAKSHIQQGEEHGYVKIIAGAIVKNQNEEEKVQVDLSEIICAQRSPTRPCDTLQERIMITSQDPDDGNYLCVSDEEVYDDYYENFNKSYHTSRTHVAKKKSKKTFQSRYSNQTKPDKTLVNSKSKFSKPDCQRSRIFKHEEGRKPELCNQSTLFVSPTEELCWSDTDQKEKCSSYSSYCDQPESPMSTREISHSCRHDERSPQSSTSHNPGCQQVLSHEDSPFATNEDCEVYYRCESPVVFHTVHEEE
ncbi:uncharacterized protein LOC144500025 [Mustelus asterias]